jgi:hypothetical protein
MPFAGLKKLRSAFNLDLKHIEATSSWQLEVKMNLPGWKFYQLEPFGCLHTARFS